MWLMYAMLSIVLWGLWGFAVKLATKYMHWYHLYVLSHLVAFLLSSFIVFKEAKAFLSMGKFALYGIVAGLFGTLGYIFFMLALREGRVSIVVPLTAVYPAITFLLGIFLLKENVEPHNVLGVFLAILGAVLISIS